MMPPCPLCTSSSFVGFPYRNEPIPIMVRAYAITVHKMAFGCFRCSHEMPIPLKLWLRSPR